MGRKLSHIAPGFIVFLSFAIVILLGTLALMHPLCRVQVIPFIDLLLTATSATCVTGHFTMPLDHFTTIGHGVILALIQIGGLGLITLSVFLISLFGNLGLTTKFMAGQLLDLEESSNIRAIILFIVRLTLCVEFIGAVIFFMVFRNSFSTGYALFLSIFHSVSSFCNAGITLFDNSLIAYNTNAPLMLTTIGLMLVGGIGFITWKEIGQYIGSLSKRKRYTFSLHSKIILYGSAVMILWTTFLFLSIEDKGALASLAITEGVLRDKFRKMENIVLFRNEDKSTSDTALLAGGWVKDPVTGMNLWVVCYDFASLYPTTQLEFFISPENFLGVQSDKDATICTNGKKIDLNEHVVCINGVVFRKHMSPTLRMLEDVYADRKKNKNIMMKKKEEYKQVMDEIKQLESELELA